MAAPPQQQESLADLVRQSADDAARLVRMEIELAKAELKETAIRVAVSAALLIVAVGLLMFAAIFLFGALPERFGTTLFGDSWKGWAVFGGLFVVVAIVLAAIGGMRLVRTFSRPPQTITSIKEYPAWVKRLTRRDTRSS